MDTGSDKKGSRSLFLLGFAFWWVWWDMFRISDSHLLPDGVGYDTDLGRLMLAVGCNVGFFLMWRFGKRIGLVCLRPKLLIASVAIIIGCMVLFYLPVVSVARPAPLALPLVIGMAGAPLFFAWFEFYSLDAVPQSPTLLPICLLLDIVLLLTALVAHLFLPTWIIILVHSAAPVASCAMLLKNVRDFRPSFSTSFDEALAKPPLRFPAKLMAALIVFGATFGFVLNFAPNLTPDHSATHLSLALEIAGAALGAVIFLAFARRFVEEPEKILSMRWAMVPFVVLSLMSLLVVGGLNPYVSKAFLWTGYEYLDLVMMTIYIRMARELAARPLTVNAQGQSADTFGIAAGMALGIAVGAVVPDVSQTALSVIVTVAVMIVIATAMNIMTDRNISTFWGMQKRPARALEQIAARRGKRLEAFADLYGLTPRETEILGELVEQKRPKLIAESLFISPETVRSHTARIYAKTGCHSQIELVKLFEEEGCEAV
ncbi:helix-turn-helix transcriptional regulator [Arabiibacter massiliensis]|uniref:helix-turn-helix transcriptional regulator n=1 Tax=Arabiibacter massiliensis TaxID=1870985 RepID=UPI00155AB510|nr:helix-turn-helix transcriptional regulator [Arabiibacter massiliensis]